MSRRRGAGAGPPDRGRAATAGPARGGRAQVARTVLACVLGACMALLAAGRTWAVTMQARPAPLPAVQLTRTGGGLVPWLSALALVALAGAGALLATRGVARLVVGVVLVLAGLGILVAAGYALLTVPGIRAGWPVSCLPAGALVAGAGVVAVRDSRRWPSMGARYERRTGGVPATAAPDDDPPVERSGPSAWDVAMWDALDRGEDPTRRSD